MKTNPCFNKTCVIALTLIVCLLASMFLTSLVKAEDGPILRKELRHIFHPFFVENNGSQNSGPLQVGFSDQPYMAGYMTTDYLSGNPNDTTANAVRVTVSFKGTDNSIIQDGNALAAGIAAQGPSSSGKVFPPEPFIDYGYTLLLVVDNQYDWPFIQGIVWEVIEWGPNNLWPLEDPVVNIAAYFTWEFPLVLTMDSNVTLIMKWDSNPYVLSFSAIIDDYPEYPINTLIPNDIQLHYFAIGTVERENQFWERYIDLPGTVKFFQFVGAWSNENIGQVGWYSYLSYPSFRRGEEWMNVTFAYSVNGTTSWLDNTVNWGGACYDNVNAYYSYQHVHFYPTSDGTTLEPDTLLWSPPPCAMKTRTDGYFYVPNVATDLLKIEMLFDDSGIEGDQCGETHYPDGAVGLDDFLFIEDGVWKAEGDDGWDYMLDICPDGTCDLDDLLVVVANYWNTGSYETDFSFVYVVFDTGDWNYVNESGYVGIPEDATNFTVYKNGNPIGAMITFW